MPSINHIKKNHRVEIVDDERAIGNGIIITLRQGWTFTPGEDNRVRGYDSVNHVYKDLPNDTHIHSGPFDP